MHIRSTFKSYNTKTNPYSNPEDHKNSRARLPGETSTISPTCPVCTPLNDYHKLIIIRTDKITMTVKRDFWERLQLSYLPVLWSGRVISLCYLFTQFPWINLSILGGWEQWKTWRMIFACLDELLQAKDRSKWS